MNERVNIFQQIMERFSFREPVPADLQKYILASKKGLLVSTLKSVGAYGFIYGMVLGLFFRVKKLGLSLSVGQSAAALGIISGIIALSLSAGIALSATLIIKPDDQKRIIEPEKKEIRTDDKKPIDEKQTIKKKRTEIFRLGVQTFSGENVENETALIVTNRITSRLRAIKGKKRVISLSGKKIKSVNLMLLGSIGKLGSMYMISARVIDVEKGKAIYITSENIESEDEINAACDRIAEQVAKRIK